MNTTLLIAAELGLAELLKKCQSCGDCSYGTDGTRPFEDFDCETADIISFMKSEICHARKTVPNNPALGTDRAEVKITPCEMAALVEEKLKIKPSLRLATIWANQCEKHKIDPTTYIENALACEDRKELEKN